MKVAGSSIAAYYAGNSALALDRQAAQQSQAAAQQRLQQFKRPQPPSEQVLEGELLNQERQRQTQASAQDEGETLTQERFHEPPPRPALSANPAIRSYQTTAQLDGFSQQGPLHQLDVYV